MRSSRGGIRDYVATDSFAARFLYATHVDRKKERTAQLDHLATELLKQLRNAIDEQFDKDELGLVTYSATAPCAGRDLRRFMTHMSKEEVKKKLGFADTDPVDAKVNIYDGRGHIADDPVPGVQLVVTRV